MIKNISIIIAILCVIIIPLSFFGIPGVGGDYANGWVKSIVTIIYFPLTFLLIFTISFILKKAIKINTFKVELIEKFLLFSLLIWFVVNLFFAFNLMTIDKQELYFQNYIPK